GRLALGEDIGGNLDAVIGEPESVRDEAHLHGGRRPVDIALPDRIARLPQRSQHIWIPDRSADELHHDGVAVAVAENIEPDLLAVEPDRAAALALHEAAGQLAGNLPLALAEHVIDGGGDRSQASRHLAFRRARG